MKSGTRRSNVKLGTAMLRGDIPVMEDKTPPTAFRIFRFGVNESDYGPFLFDATAAANVMGAYQSDGKPLLFDYNHNAAASYPGPENGISAGQFEIEVRENGELWAVNIVWTPRAAAYIAAGEYRLFSPLFQHDEGEPRRICKLLNLALVNLAGLKHIQPIAAAANLGDNDMELEAQLAKANADLAVATAKLTSTGTELAAANDKITALAADVATLRSKDASRDIVALAGAVALPPTSGTTEIVAAAAGLTTFRKEILGLTGKVIEGEAIGVIKAWKQADTQVVELRAAAEADKQATRETAFTAALSGAVKEGKIPPAQKAYWESECKVDGKVTERGLASLTAFVQVATPIVTTTTATATATQPATGGAALTDQDRAFAKLSGVSEAALLKAKQGIEAATAAAGAARG